MGAQRRIARLAGASDEQEVLDPETENTESCDETMVVQSVEPQGALIVAQNDFRSEFTGLSSAYEEQNRRLLALMRAGVAARERVLTRAEARIAEMLRADEELIDSQLK